MLFSAVATAQRRRVAGSIWAWCGLLALAAVRLPWETVWVGLIAAPWLEELLFREGLQRSLQKRFHCSVAPVLLTALAFATVHVLFRPDMLSAATVLPGLVLGNVYARTQDLALCACLHAAFNFAWHAGLMSLLSALWPFL